jgi:hypothetical protein
VLKDNLQRKGQMFQEMQYLFFFAIKEPFKKNDVHQKDFCKTLAF